MVINVVVLDIETKEICEAYDCGVELGPDRHEMEGILFCNDCYATAMLLAARFVSERYDIPLSMLEVYV